MMEANRTLEYLGMAKCSLKSEDIKPLLASIGRLPFPEEEVEQHLAKCKARDIVVEKNKKAKAGKKPEEPVPLLDNIEQIAILDSEGAEVMTWVLLRNVQYKHLNFCMNPEVDDELEEELRAILKRTNDDFGLTLSGCGLTKEVVEKAREQLVQAKAALPPGPEGESKADAMIGYKRLAY